MKPAGFSPKPAGFRWSTPRSRSRHQQHLQGKGGGGKNFVDFSCTISINTPQRPVFANGKGGGTKKRDRQCLSPSLSILDKKDTAPNPPPRLPSAPNPARRIGAESEEIPTIAQFSAKPETERWREFLSWCRWWDSNPHGVATGGF